MTWTIIAQLLAQFGVPLVEQLIAKWKAGGAVTPEEVAALLALAQQTARDRMLKTLQAQGIDPNSPQGQALLALT